VFPITTPEHTLMHMRFAHRALPLVALLMGTAAQAQQSCVIRLAYNEVAAPPYYFGDRGKTPPNPGPAIELVDLAAKQLGCQITWQRKPLKRIIRELEANAIDATLALSYSKERTRFWVYPLKGEVPDASLALWTLSYHFYVKRGSTLSWDGQQFNRPPRRVGANAGYSVVSDLAKLGLVAEEAPGDLNNLGKLVHERIEAYAGQSLFVDQLREQPEFQGLERLEPPIVRKDYFLVFSHAYYRANPDTVNKLWRLIPELKKSHGAALDRKYQAPQGTTTP